MPFWSAGAATVHPRWRGEHPHMLDAAMHEGGSSPLARGTHRLTGGIALLLRFIPAGAGNTRPCALRQSCHPIHPRWRGEHADRGTAMFSGDGSSPLARGTLVGIEERMSSIRFIPAGAGNTVLGRRRNPLPAVHPRWRGEHLLCRPRR